MRESPNHRFLVSALLASLLVIGGALIFLLRGLPEENIESLDLTPDAFQFVAGSGEPSRGKLLINGFSDGYAVVTSGPVNIQAKNQHILRFQVDLPGNQSTSRIFWRIKSDPENLQQVDIYLAGTQYMDLSRYKSWHGEITEIGFLFFDDNPGYVTLGPASLQPDTAANRLERVWRSWTNFEPWSLKSINFVAGGELNQLLPLPLLMMTWFIVSLLLHWLRSRPGTGQGHRNFLVSACLLFVMAWMMLDIRWSANNLRQMKQSVETNWNVNDEQRMLGELDADLYENLSRIKKEFLSDQLARILVVGEESTRDYELQRASYHLLPHSSYRTRRLLERYEPEYFHYVVFLGGTGSILNVPGWNKNWDQAVQPLMHWPAGVFYQVKQDSSDVSVSLP
jgi:hypothetical protein